MAPGGWPPRDYSEACKQHMAFSGIWQAFMHRILCPREDRQRATLCCKAPNQNALFQSPSLERTPRPRHTCHQARVCLRNKLAQTWTSPLKTWVYLLIPKGKYGTVTMEKLGKLPLHRGLEVMRVLRSDPTPLLWSSGPKGIT